MDVRAKEECCCNCVHCLPRGIITDKERVRDNIGSKFKLKNTCVYYPPDVNHGTGRGYWVSDCGRPHCKKYKFGIPSDISYIMNHLEPMGV